MRIRAYWKTLPRFILHSKHAVAHTQLTHPPRNIFSMSSLSAQEFIYIFIIFFYCSDYFHMHQRCDAYVYFSPFFCTFHVLPNRKLFTPVSLILLLFLLSSNEFRISSHFSSASLKQESNRNNNIYAWVYSSYVCYAYGTDGIIINNNKRINPRMNFRMPNILCFCFLLCAIVYICRAINNHTEQMLHYNINGCRDFGIFIFSLSSTALIHRDMQININTSL